jgi:hypothetical protein
MSQDHVDPVNETAPGRDAKGRFTAGNTGGPGNPFGRRLAMMREAVMRAVSADDVEQLLRKLLALAMDGDLAAAKLVLQYAVGKPKPVAEPDRVDVEAWENEKEKWAEPGEVNDILGKVPVRFGALSSEVLVESRCKQLAQALRTFDPNNPDASLTEEPMSPERVEELKRQFYEHNARVEAEMAARDEELHRKTRPSKTASNGHAKPSFAGGNGKRHRR